MTRIFTHFANVVAEGAGNPFTFIGCFVLVLLWAISGPLFGFSDTWQLVINTSTTIVTFLMVFLIQNTQNRDNGAIHAKLDELIRATSGADNEYIGIEHLTDRELKVILEQVEENAHRIRDERRRRERASRSTGADGDKNPPRNAAPASPKPPARKAPSRRKAQT